MFYSPPPTMGSARRAQTDSSARHRSIRNPAACPQARIPPNGRFWQKLPLLASPSRSTRTFLAHPRLRPGRSPKAPDALDALAARRLPIAEHLADSARSREHRVPNVKQEQMFHVKHSRASVPLQRKAAKRRRRYRLAELHSGDFRARRRPTPPPAMDRHTYRCFT